ncbi:MAG: redoxin domain-containing protein [Myxococcales bacterium]|nr:redoxin domain-containing protein [Myxococcales bacterium]
MTLFVRSCALALSLLVAGCAGETGGAATVNTGSDTAATSDAGAATDTGSAGGAQDSGSTNPVAKACKADGDCDSNVCHAGACSKTCTASADCGKGQLCSQDAKQRLLCTPPKFSSAIGADCGANGKCADGLKCVGRAYSAQAFCTAACAADTDCPGTFRCIDVPGAGNICVERAFCGECQHDSQCPAGGACVKMTTGSFCTSPCAKQGDTRCPRFAKCTDLGGTAGFQCVHAANTCIGTGKQCDPCNPLEGGQCGKGKCLQYNHTKEAFCALPCTKSCASGFNCQKISAAGEQACVPADKKMPKCVSDIHPMYEVGSVMDDFAMVGMVDIDGDGLLHDEDPRVIRLSDFEEFHTLLLVNVTAVWCSACQAETIDMSKWMINFGSAKVELFQILFDGAKPGQLMTFPLLKEWQKQLKPVGAVGMDPNRFSAQWNTGGSTPLNMLIDAKTRKVLWKSNGYNKSVMINEINKQLKALGK